MQILFPAERPEKKNYPRLLLALALVALVIFAAVHWHWLGHEMNALTDLTR